MRVDLKHGLNISLGDPPLQTISEHNEADRIALVLDDHLDLQPVLSVAAGDTVALGQQLFADRRQPQVAFTSPTTGVVREIQRGAKRRIRQLIIERDGDRSIAFPKHSVESAAKLSRAAVHTILKGSGAWTAIRARPFDRIAAIEIEPRAIFVTAIDTFPLAPDPAVVLADQAEQFTVGITALTTLTRGPVYVCVAPDSPIEAPDTKQVRRLEFGGPHPAGLPGTHMHAVGLKVNQQPDLWHIGYQDVAAIGTLLLTGRVANERVISVAGPCVRRPRLVRTRLGIETTIFDSEGCPPRHRVFSGSPFSAAEHAQFLGRYDSQLVLMPEKAAAEISPGTWIANIRKLLPAADIDATSDTSINGWTSGMLPVEAFEKIWPFSMPPNPLLRALLAGDTESAALLGCLGLAEEDLALCEFICPAKQNYSTALRKALRDIEQYG